MNVKTPLFPHVGRSKRSSLTSTTTDDLPVPSQHYWTMSQYLEISLPLTAAVILLPLIAGPIFRFTKQQYERHTLYWRASFVLLAACYFMGLIVLYELHPLGSVYPFVYLWISYPLLGAIWIERMMHAYKHKQDRLRRSLQVLTFLVFLMIDLFAIIAIPWVLVALLFMFLMSEMGMRWLKGMWTWLSWKTRRQSGAGYSSVTTV